MPSKKIQIRNSTAEFLIFSTQANENTIEVMVQDESVWLTQKMIAALFETTKQNIGQHLKNIFEEAELREVAVVKKFFTTADDGKQYDSKDNRHLRHRDGLQRGRCHDPNLFCLGAKQTAFCHSRKHGSRIDFQ